MRPRRRIDENALRKFADAYSHSPSSLLGASSASNISTVENTDSEGSHNGSNEAAYIPPKRNVPSSPSRNSRQAYSRGRDTQYAPTRKASPIPAASSNERHATRRSSTEPKPQSFHRTDTMPAPVHTQGTSQELEPAAGHGHKLDGKDEARKRDTVLEGFGSGPPFIVSRPHHPVESHRSATWLILSIGLALLVVTALGCERLVASRTSLRPATTTPPASQRDIDYFPAKRLELLESRVDELGQQISRVRERVTARNLAYSARLLPDRTSTPSVGYTDILYSIFGLSWPRDMTARVLLDSDSTSCWPVSQHATVGLEFDGTVLPDVINLESLHPAKYWIMAAHASLCHSWSVAARTQESSAKAAELIEPPSWWRPSDHDCWSLVGQGVSKSTSDTGKPASLNLEKIGNNAESFRLVILIETGGRDCFRHLHISPSPDT